MNPDSTIEVSLQQLRSVINDNLALLGLNSEESEVVADVILYAELRDKAQGLIKVLEKTVAPDPGRTAMQLERRSAVLHLLHANGHSGMVVLNRASSVTIEACGQTGLALTGTRGTASSTGSIGFYAERIARAGYIALVMAGSPKVMALEGSRLPALGTNPLAIAVPTLEAPLVFDMATAATTWFDLIRCAREGRPIDRGLALDSNGEATTSAAAALEGVMLTFGGSKGSGLALMLEMLTGPLMGAAQVGDTHDSRGNFVLAINPAMLIDDFPKRAQGLLDQIRSGPLRAGQQTLRLPGEYSSALARERLAAGRLPINRGVYQQLCANVGYSAL